MMSTVTPQKFAFDLDLGRTNERTQILGESQLNILLKEAQQKGYAKGVTDGENSAANRAAAALSAAAQNIANKTIAIAAASDKLQKQTLCAATDLGVSVGKKLAANLITRAPIEEIRALIGECLGSLDNVPHLVIRCHPDLAEAVEIETKTQMQTSGFTGRLIIMGEPDILLGDARLEWVDGGLVRDLSGMSDQIDERVNTFIAANCPDQTPNSSQSPNSNQAPSPTIETAPKENEQ